MIPIDIEPTNEPAPKYLKVTLHIAISYQILQTVLLIETVHNFIFKIFFKCTVRLIETFSLFQNSTVNRTVRLIEILE